MEAGPPRPNGDGDGRRTVEEARFGRDQRDGDLLAREMAHGEQRLDRRHAAARDQDARAGRADATEMRGVLRHARAP